MLMLRDLPLVQESAAHRGTQFVDGPREVLVIRLGQSREADAGRVMEIVVAHRIEAVAPFFDRAHEPHVLRLVFGQQNDIASTGRLPRGLRHFGENVRVGVVENLLRRVEAEAIEMKFLDPIPHICDEELADRTRVLIVEIDGGTPFVLVALREIVVGEFADRAVRSIRNGCRPRRESRPNRARAARSTKRRKSSGAPYSRVGANRQTPS